jgi:hypothetical protein
VPKRWVMLGGGHWRSPAATNKCQGHSDEGQGLARQQPDADAVEIERGSSTNREATAAAARASAATMSSA